MRTRIIPVLIQMLVVAMVSMIGGCGSSSDQTTATSTDKITAPADVSLTVGAGTGSPGCGGGGTALYTQLVFVVTDFNNIPKSGVDVDLWTDGFWYTDATYVTNLIGVGPFNVRTETTDSSGRVVVFWSTELLPAHNPVTGAPAVAGADQTGDSFVQAYSGTITNIHHVAWTVKGCTP